MSSVRLRRLTADFNSLSDYVKRHPRLRMVQAEGDPAERYQLEYRIKSLRDVDGDLKVIKSHIVEIALPRNYPRMPPQCRMLSPVFHPNIAPHAICVGDHWSAGESLQSIVLRIGEMLAYQSYNTKSPLNGEAARWVAEHEEELPLDPVSMLVEGERDADTGPAPPPPAAPAASPRAEPPRQRRPPAESSRPRQRPAQSSPPRRQAPPAPQRDRQEQIIIQCPGCEKRFRVQSAFTGRKVECPNCRTAFEATPQI